MSEETKDSNVDKEQFFPKYSYGSINYANLGKLILQDMKRKSRVTSRLVNYSREDIIRFIETPEKYQLQLRDVSKKLYSASPHYRRAVNYFAKLLRFDYIVEPVRINIEKINVDTFKNQYIKVCDFLSIMNIKHEFMKVLTVAFKEDCYFGYEHRTKDSFFFQRLNGDYCRISSIEDGVYNFAFDFTYFNRYPEQLKLFPNEFRVKYKRFMKDSELRYQELDPKKTICIKVNEDTDTIIPPLSSVFESVYELNDYKKLRKASKQIGAYKLLTMKVPMMTKREEVNGFLVDYNTMMEFHNRSAESVPEEIGIITVPFDVDSVDFSSNVKDEDSVGDAENELWGEIGVSKLLFNSNDSSSVGLAKSITTDETIVFAVARQIERWINRRLSYEFKNLKFKICILDTTIFNWETVYEKAINGATHGLPTKSMACASLGLNPSSVLNMSFLENDVLELPKILVPLASTYTMSGTLTEDLVAGAPLKDDDELSDEGLASRDGEKNIDS